VEANEARSRTERPLGRGIRPPEANHRRPPPGSAAPPCAAEVGALAEPRQRGVSVALARRRAPRLRLGEPRLAVGSARSRPCSAAPAAPSPQRPRSGQAPSAADRRGGARLALQRTRSRPGQEEAPYLGLAGSKGEFSAIAALPAARAAPCRAPQSSFAARVRRSQPSPSHGTGSGGPSRDRQQLRRALPLRPARLHARRMVREPEGVAGSPMPPVAAGPSALGRFHPRRQGWIPGAIDQRQTRARAGDTT
jgi:hypothetical protein